MRSEAVKRLVMLGLLVVGIQQVAWGQLARAMVEKPKYEVLSEREGYEIRRFPAHIVARVAITGDVAEAMNRGFRPLADYIFGENVAEKKVSMTSPVVQEAAPEKIAMTSPVVQEPGASSPGAEATQYVSFIMPSEYTLETLPKPKNEQVELKEVAEQVMAVRRFSWTGNHKQMLMHEKALREALARDGIEITGTVRYARYDPPWTIPIFRRNEVMLPIKYPKD